MFLQLVHAQTGMSPVLRECSGSAVLGLGTGMSWGWTLPLSCCGWDGTVGTQWLSLGDITDLPPSEQRGDTALSLSESPRGAAQPPLAAPIPPLCLEPPETGTGAAHGKQLPDPVPQQQAEGLQAHGRD